MTTTKTKNKNCCSKVVYFLKIAPIMSPDKSNNDYSDETTNVSWTGDTVPTNATTSSTTEHADSSVTTFDIHPTSSSSSSKAIAPTATTTPNTAKWTRYLPEAYGIRRSVESSKYRWCARESAMWGIATGSAMALHRIRMNSPLSRIINIGFGTTFLVMGGSYYFCVKRRDYQEQMIELLMQLNTFEPVQNMPPERPIDHTHPFVAPMDDDNDDDDDITRTSKVSEVVPTKQYVAHLPERKDWQAPLPTQDASDIFQPYNGGEKNDNIDNNKGRNDTSKK